MAGIVNKALSLTNPSAKVPPTPEEMTGFANQLARVRETRTGRMHQRYQSLPPEQSIQAMYGDLLDLAKQGKPGRYWYEKSSKRILQYVGGDKDAADKFAQLIAIYSPQTTVPVNTGNAIKAYNRAKAGSKLWDGDIVDRDRTFKNIKESSDYVKSLGGENAGITKVPLDDSGKRFLIARHKPKSYENIATADRDLKAHLLMNEGIPFEGRKTNNFYNNLMVHIDPSRLQGSTQDLWMAHAFGFPDVAVGSSGKYDFMEKITKRLSDQLGWRPHQVQAAIWTAIKTRMEGVADDAKKAAISKGMATMQIGPKGKPRFTPNEGAEDQIAELHRDMALGKKVSRKHILESAKDFSDFMDQNLAHITWESAPSKDVAHLNGIEALSPEAKAEYHGMASKALQDKDGNDLLAKYLGIMSPGSKDAPGYWQGKTNPATHTQMASTRIKAALQQPDIDEPSKHLLDIYATAKGLLHKQDGVGYHRPFYNPQITKANGIEYQFDKDLTDDHIRNIGQSLDKTSPGASLIPVNNRTVRILNFSDQHQNDQRGFHKATDSVMSTAVPSTHTATKRAFASDGNLVENDWKVNKNGEDYRRRLSAAGRPDVHEFVSSVLAPRLEAVDREFAQKHGLKTDPQLEQSIRTPQAVQPNVGQGASSLLGNNVSGPRQAFSKGGDTTPAAPSEPEGMEGVSGEGSSGLLGNGRNFTGFFSNITSGLTGAPASKEGYKPAFDISGISPFSQEYHKHLGKFDDHIGMSIPGFREVQQGVGHAIANTFPNGGDMIDIGASEGALNKSISALTGGRMRTVALDPNPSMQQSFHSISKVLGAEYALGAYGNKEDEGQTAWTEDQILHDKNGVPRPNPYADMPIKYYTPDRKFDVAHEAMVFQFMNNNRHAQVARAKELLHPHGILINEEKFVPGEGLPQDEFAANEAKKDAYKERFFTKEDIAKKAAAILHGKQDEFAAEQKAKEAAVVGMHDLQVPPGEMEKVLKKHFKHVAQIWDSGNFKGYASSDSPEHLNRFLSHLPNMNSEFSTKQTPRMVDHEEDEKGKIGAAAETLNRGGVAKNISRALSLTSLYALGHDRDAG